MGVLADLLANADSIDTTLPREAGNRVTVRKIKDFIARLGDRDYPSGTDAANEVQSIAAFGGSPSAGDFTLTFNLFGGLSFTTAAIAFDANAATIEAAIDAVAATVVPGFAAGDIAVTGGPLTTTPVVLTFDGASVAEKNHDLTEIDASGVTGGTAGEVTESTAGQPLRTAMSALVVLGILSEPLPAHGATTGFVVQNARGAYPHGLDQDTVKDIVHEIGIQEGSADVEAALLTALGY